MVNPDDWDPASNGEMKFKSAAIAPFSSNEEHEEVRKYRKTAPFTMTFTLGNGDVCAYTGDQCNAWSNAQIEGKLTGPAASKYVLLQNSGTSRGEYRNNLALIERMDMADWMARVSDDALLSRLLIPGTHESCAVQGNPVSICQTLSIADQLKAGIRFLDIRCRHYNDNLEIHHSSDYQGIRFSDVRDACVTFLASHPSETIIMLVNEEYKAAGCTESFEATFW
jgi:1-phosphatidylinositol phosphodiesterase